MTTIYGNRQSIIKLFIYGACIITEKCNVKKENYKSKYANKYNAKYLVPKICKKMGGKNIKIPNLDGK